MEILPTWLLEDLEKLRRTQEERPQLRVELPNFISLPDEITTNESENSIVIPLR